ncbi:MAG: two-component system response regulator [Archangium gephyra]|uniref:Two-component system response regulator n=1 Tax=Archangium gephyra TaxID=48 RepID=A0A2W5TSK6_9BACT|nr:MAG: two-component system response regulator [Archangium gephyra]
MLNLLVVDDEPMDRTAVRRALAAAGLKHLVTEASGGEEALRLLREGTLPQERRMVLLDMDMPGMHGLEFLRQLRKDEALTSTPVLVLATQAKEDTRKQAHALNCAGYFVKPHEFEGLTELMRTIERYWSNAYFAR